MALLDPDMLLIRPLSLRLAEGLFRRRASPPPPRGERQQELADAGGVGRALARDVAGLPSRVARGVPAGQHFGIGGVWARAMTPSARKSWVSFSKVGAWC